MKCRAALIGLCAVAVAAQSSHDADPGAKALPPSALPPLDAHPAVALTFDDLPADQFMDSRHLKYPAVKPKPFAKLKSLCQ